MTPAAAFRLTDEELASLWNIKRPCEIAAHYGLTREQSAKLSLRVSRLRKQGWEIKKWNDGRNGLPWARIHHVPPELQ